MAITSKSTSNKSTWLWFILVITILLTVWTALQDEPHNEESVEELLNVRQPRIKNMHRNTISPSITKKSTFSDSKENMHIFPNNATEALRKPLQNKVPDIFRPHTWTVVKPEKSTLVLAPPPPPTAPIAPFSYIGKMEEAPSGTQIFLSEGNKIHTVRIGQQINAQWRLDEESPHAVTLTYLPLNLTQSLSKNKNNMATSPRVMPLQKEE